MRKIVVLLTFMTLIACGKSTYYVYEKYKYDPDFRVNYLHSYCALEITPKKEVIFRGASNEYYIYNKKTTYFDDNSSSYIYIYSDKEATWIDEYGIYFCQRPSECFYFSPDVYEIETEKYKFQSISINDYYNAKNWNKQYIKYGFDEKNKDSLVLSKTNNVIDFIKSEVAFRSANIPWFPPYLVKVKKIDYNKFKRKCRRLKYAHFKDPRKFAGKVLHVDKPY
ncbi:hypothetical protein BZL53_13280 [Flavobacterium columnare]|uniref:hypothetical protein n=1 Tax=Flavobacterium TaxID=237 RepID=UPI0009816DFF|nr:MULTISPECIES: hypothetical protein [Flavobacterium]OOB81988.1 hypothetical protein BZL53_13280 [Flavobacterium columnare]OWP86095.1 hypothetical protein BWK60_10600 [Flavobacterium covae]